MRCRRVRHIHGCRDRLGGKLGTGRRRAHSTAFLPWNRGPRGMSGSCRCMRCCGRRPPRRMSRTCFPRLPRLLFILPLLPPLLLLGFPSPQVKLLHDCMQLPALSIQHYGHLLATTSNPIQSRQLLSMLLLNAFTRFFMSAVLDENDPKRSSRRLINLRFERRDYTVNREAPTDMGVRCEWRKVEYQHSGGKRRAR